MFEVRAVLKIALFLVQSDDFDLVGRVLDEGAKGEAEVFLGPVAEVYRVQVPLRLMRVNLLLFCLRLRCLRYSRQDGWLTVPRVVRNARVTWFGRWADSTLAGTLSCCLLTFNWLIFSKYK